MSPLQEEVEPKRRKRTIRLFDESGMTEQERRQVRHKQRCLHDKIEQGNVQDDDTDNIQFLSAVRDENNQLFDTVRFTREAVLDADNANLIVSKTLNEVDKLRQVRENLCVVNMFCRLARQCTHLMIPPFVCSII